MKSMKKYTLLFLLFLATASVQAQTKPKPKQKEVAPTQKEMEAMMKEAQKAMDNMDPKTKKMMDSMGIKMPSFNSIPVVTDAQLQEAFENENRIVPVKDVKRIASISKTPLTNAALPIFLSTTQGKVASRLKSTAKTKGEEIYQLIKTQYNSPIATGNTAAGLWMLGKAELALYVIGKACLDNPTNADNVNNYAAMLSMSGAEQLALPLLTSLNKRFPKNSTLLNNIGQAWFGLGDIDKANSYLDSAIHIYAYHPQANYTKSFIEESKDHKTAAIEAMRKSINYAYTPVKEDRLRKLGHPLSSKDINWKMKKDPDPLGLNNFKYPDFPTSVEASFAYEIDLKEFQDRCDNEIAKLTTEFKVAQAKMVEADKIRNKENVNIINNVINTGNPGQLTILPFFAPKALPKLKALEDGGYHAEEKAGKDAAMYPVSNHLLSDDYKKEIEKLQEEDLEQTGEGKPNKDYCPKYRETADKFLMAYNPGAQRAYDAYLHQVRLRVSEEMYWSQYVQWSDQFEVTKLNAKIGWLQRLKDLKGESITTYKCAPKKAPKGGVLAEFDDVHCEYHSELKTPVGKIRTDCSRMTTELDLKFVKLGLKQDMNKETFGDQFMNCSVEVGAGVSVGSKELGPLKAEASVGASIAMEFDRTGLKDVNLKGAAGVSLGTNVISDGSKGDNDVKVGTETKDGSAGDVGVINDLQLEAGVKGQVSIISGKASIEGTGILSILSK